MGMGVWIGVRVNMAMGMGVRVRWEWGWGGGGGEGNGSRGENGTNHFEPKPIYIIRFRDMHFIRVGCLGGLEDNYTIIMQQNTQKLHASDATTFICA